VKKIYNKQLYNLRS